MFPPLAQVGEVVLVYDGKPGEPASTGGDDPTVVITAGGDESNGVPRVSADDWILDAISREDRRTIHSSSPLLLASRRFLPSLFYRRDQTEVITADRYLRKAAQARTTPLSRAEKQSASAA